MVACVVGERKDYVSMLVSGEKGASRFSFTLSLPSPRPFYPKSWLWSEDEAALHLQRYVRGWLVRKRADVQEMREFWKKWAASDVRQQETSRMYLTSYPNAYVYDAKAIISDECALRFDKELRQTWDNGHKYRWL